MNNIALYKKYFVDNNFERLGLFELLRDTYAVCSALYPGSFIHVTPAYVFQRTTFVDSDRRVQQFFDSEEVRSLVKKNKQYSEESELFALQQNYEKSLPKLQPYDLLISQYAGFVSQAGKRYLKKDGLLLVNNSHGDASMAFLDDDYQLIGSVSLSRGKWNISDSNLDSYFNPKKLPHPTKKEIQVLMKGVGYTKSAAHYIFKKRL